MKSFSLTNLLKGAFSPPFYSLKKKVAAWPTVAIDANQSLYVGFSGDRKRHVDPYGKNYLIKSTDLGKTWSKPLLVCNSPLDDRDVGLLILKDGTVLYSSFNSTFFKKWYKTYPVVGSPTGFVFLSKDQGETFIGPYLLPINAPHGPIQGSDGLLYYLGNRLDNGNVELYTSLDGKSWSLKKELFPGKYFCEPHMIEIEPGTFLALFRAAFQKKSHRYLYESWSHDSGATWSTPKRTNLYGYPPHLLRLSSGKILATYASRYWPFTIRAAISSDGKEWKKLGVIGLGSCDDFGYPSTVELPDGSLFTVYYDKDVLKAVRSWTK